jgi:hypothetical protein
MLLFLSRNITPLFNSACVYTLSNSSKNNFAVFSSSITKTFSSFRVSPPHHGQLFHVQIPIEYKGIEMGNYTQRERLVLQILQTYLARPDEFTRLSKGVSSYLSAPVQLEEDPHILCVYTGEDRRLIKLDEKKLNSSDPGAVRNSVIRIEDQDNVFDLFFFYHSDIGTMEETKEKRS